MWSVWCILYELITNKPLFPGKSTKHMFALVIEVTGLPDKNEYKELKNLYGFKIEHHMFDKISKKSMKKLIGQYTRDPSTFDLLNKLLMFNPEKIITIEEAIAHSYVRDFHNKDEEIACERKITIPMDDTQKFTLDQYRQKLYEEVLRRKIEIKKKLIESIKRNHV